jgi:hypothetical protein
MTSRSTPTRIFFALSTLSLATALLLSAVTLSLAVREPGTVWLSTRATPTGSQSVRLVAWNDGFSVLRFAPPGLPTESHHPLPRREYLFAAFILPIAWLLAHPRRDSLTRPERWLTAASALSPLLIAIHLRHPDPPSITDAGLAWLLIAALGVRLIWPAATNRLEGAARWTPSARRRARGLCSHCGYDLRATPDRCPECGTEAATARTMNSD